MKKMLIFGGIIIVLFAAIFAVTQMEKKMHRQMKKVTTQIKFLLKISIKI